MAKIESYVILDRLLSIVDRDNSNHAGRVRRLLESETLDERALKELIANHDRARENTP